MFIGHVTYSQGVMLYFPSVCRRIVSVVEFNARKNLVFEILQIYSSVYYCMKFSCNYFVIALGPIITWFLVDLTASRHWAFRQFHIHFIGGLLNKNMKFKPRYHWLGYKIFNWYEIFGYLCKSHEQHFNLD